MPCADGGKVKRFGQDILDAVSFKMKQDIMNEEDENILRAIALAGCPEGCLVIFKESLI